MRKALIVQGNPTTTGGVVIGGSAFGMTDNGRPFALYGDEATCGNCKGAFKIFGTATGRCYDGRAGVIEGDLVLCPCGRNRVLSGSNPGCFYEDDSGSAGASSIAGNTFEQGDATDELEHYFEIADAVTGAPIEGMTYKLFSDGIPLVDDKSLVTGKTMAFSKKEHPNLTFVAWRTGDVR